MSVQETNFCRQLIAQIAADGAPADESVFQAYQFAGSVSHWCHKFILPVGGRILADPELKALEGELNLPFPDVALEYFEPALPRQGEVLASKRIVFASHIRDLIQVIPAFYADKEKKWMVLPGIVIPSTEWRQDAGGIRFTKFDQRFPDADYRDDVSVLLCFLNALGCSNVHTEKIAARKKGKAKAALPFDEYHVLTIDVPNKATSQADQGGTHRSPREHLRRGHIRRLQDGRAIWVNAAVIAAGRGAGKITKDYQIN